MKLIGDWSNWDIDDLGIGFVPDFVSMEKYYFWLVWE